ncbi:MAG: chromosomal replication initiator protein DnaA [Paludibacteraceae bacterium]|nr:chromosomal replication initiator protein DnaA [Paludibacteraceae bacterium]
MERHQQLWNECLSIIKDNISEDHYKTWFMPIVPIKFDGKDLLLQVPSQFFYEYIEECFADLIRKSIEKVIGPNIRLLYKITIVRNRHDNGGDITMPTTVGKTIENTPQGFALTEATKNSAEDLTDFDCHLNPKYTFDNFIQGDSNKLARCAGLNIAAHPGESVFNPIFIYGAPAVGKTHLANAIGIAIKQRYARKRVIYVSAHLFQIQFQDARVNNKINDFINFYQSVDVLILDDIQEFIGKPGTQNTFFHILNHLLLIGKQIIICCDKKPGELEGMEERLVTRFKMGLSVEIERPNYELRKDILNHKICIDGLSIDEEVVNYVARNVTTNVRELEGTLASILAHSTFLNADINVELAEKIIGKTAESKPMDSETQIERLYDIIGHAYGFTKEDICSRRSNRKLSEARQVIMYLANSTTNISMTKIGSLIGNRDHTTVIYACKCIKNQMDVNPTFCETVRKFERQISE